MHSRVAARVCGKPIMCGSVGKGCESFHRLEECVNYGDVCVILCVPIGYVIEFLLLLKSHGVFI